MKVYQMTQEQVDNFSNDLIDVLQETQRTAKILLEYNLNSKSIADNLQSNKDIYKEIEFLLNSIGDMREKQLSEFKGIDEISSIVQDNTIALNKASKGIDKKIDAAVGKLVKRVNTRNTIISLLGGFILGFLVFSSVVTYTYGVKIIPKIYNDTLAKTEKVK